MHGQNHFKFDVFYFDFSKAFHPIPHALLLCNIDDFGPCPADVTGFHSYLTSSLSHVRYRDPLSTP